MLGRTVGPGALSRRVAESERRGVARALCFGEGGKVEGGISKGGY